MILNDEGLLPPPAFEIPKSGNPGRKDKRPAHAGTQVCRHVLLPYSVTAKHMLTEFEFRRLKFVEGFLFFNLANQFMLAREIIFTKSSRSPLNITLPILFAVEYAVLRIR